MENDICIDRIIYDTLAYMRIRRLDKKTERRKKTPTNDNSNVALE
jgi:hypothetical protein